MRVKVEDKVEIEQNDNDRKEKNIRKLWIINSENLISKHKNLERKKGEENINETI